MTPVSKKVDPGKGDTQEDCSFDLHLNFDLSSLQNIYSVNSVNLSHLNLSCFISFIFIDSVIYTNMLFCSIEMVNKIEINFWEKISGQK